MIHHARYGGCNTLIQAGLINQTPTLFSNTTPNPKSSKSLFPPLQP